MQKINFKNLPDTTTPVNATNLNQLQTNVSNELDNKTNYKEFSLSAGTSKIIHFTSGGTSSFFLSGKGSAVEATLLWYIVAFGDGGSSRNKVYDMLSNISGLTTDIVYSISGRDITITNNMSSRTMRFGITIVEGDDIIEINDPSS